MYFLHEVNARIVQMDAINIFFPLNITVDLEIEVDTGVEYTLNRVT